MPARKNPVKRALDTAKTAVFGENDPVHAIEHAMEASAAQLDPARSDPRVVVPPLFEKPDEEDRSAHPQHEDEARNPKPDVHHEQRAVGRAETKKPRKS